MIDPDKFEGFPPIPDFLKRSKDEKPPEIPPDVPKVMKFEMKGVGERYTKKREKEEAFLRIKNKMMKGERTTIRRLGEEFPNIKKDRIAWALHKLNVLHLVEKDGHWYQWAKSK